MQIKKTNSTDVQASADNSGTWTQIFIYTIGILSFVTFALDFLIESVPTEIIFKSIGFGIIALCLLTLLKRFQQNHQPASSGSTTSPSLKANSQNTTPSVTTSSNHLEILGRLAGGVAHDFNNSLMVLVNCIEVMRTTDDSITKQALLVDMESAARGAQSTAQQLMSLSKEGSTPGQPSDPRSALRSIAANLRRMFPENIIIKDLLRGTRSVSLVSGQFEQVILNLCLNCKDEMPRGGELTLRCYEDAEDNLVIIEIENSTNAEFNSKKLPPIEDSSVYTNVTKAGGHISVSIMESKGTTITLRLPIIEKKDMREAEQVSVSLTVKKRKLRALLLDDDEMVLTMLNTRFLKSGYETSVCTNISEAMRLLTELSFDVLISDAVLPDGIPTEVIEKFRNLSDGPVVICSGYSKNDPLLAGLKTETSIFFQKPFSIDDLINRLENIKELA